MICVFKNEEPLTDWIGIAIKEAAPILLITGSGGAFGKVITATSVVEFIEGVGSNAFFTGAMFIFIPFIIAVALKTRVFNCCISY